MGVNRGFVRWVVAVSMGLGASCAVGAALAQGDEGSSFGNTESTAAAETTDASEETSGPAPAAEPLSPEAAKVLEGYDTSECLPSCEPGYECVQGKCESRCNPPCGGAEVCTGLGVCERLGVVKQHMDEAATRRVRHRRDTTLTGVRGFAGLLMGGGVTLHAREEQDGDGLMDPNTYGAMYLAIRGGLMVDIAELSAEYSPGLYKPMAGGSEGILDQGKFMQSLLGNAGVHIPMTDMIYWPLRVGAGFIASSGRFDFQGRLDLFNISVKTKYFLFDASFPSLRYASDLDTYHRWTGLFTVGASYITP